MATQQSRYKLDAEAKDNFILPIQETLYKEDIIRFAEEQFFIPETNKPIVLEKWQKKLLTKIFKRRKSGVRQYRLALLMIPKKNGKSTLASLAALWALFYDCENAEVYLCSGDLDQSNIVFRMVTAALRRNPALYERVNITSNLIELKTGRGFLRAVSSDAPTLHGINPSFVIFDELWTQQNDDLWTAVSLPPTRKNPMTFVITYAGYSQDSLLYRLYSDGVKKRNKRMFFFHSTKNLASWVKKDYLEQQKKILHPTEFARLHRCEWVDSIDSFFESSDIDGCVDLNLSPQVKSDPKFQYFLGLDLGIKHDRTVTTICHYDPKIEGVVVDEIQTWQGTRENPQDIKEVEDYVFDAYQRYHCRIICDPWQAIQLIQTLKKKNLPIEEFPFSAPNVNKIAQNLFFLFHNRRIKIFPHKELINELKSVQMVSKSYGYRIDTKTGKGSSKAHDDHVISLAISSYFAVQQKKRCTPEVFMIKKDPDEE